MPLLPAWKKAKKTFEDTSGKKRPGMNPSKFAKFFKVFQSETGLTPLFEKFDKLELALGAKGLSGEQQKQGLVALEAALQDVKTKGQDYQKKLAQSIKADLDDEDDMQRALKNFDNEIEAILKRGKSIVISIEAGHEATEKAKTAKSPQELIAVGVISKVKSAPADLQRAAAGLQVIVRNIAANPTRRTFTDAIEGDCAARWATTALQAVDMACDASKPLKQAIKTDVKAVLNALRDYGANKNISHWNDLLAKGDETTLVKNHAKAMADQIQPLKDLAKEVKDALAKAG